MTGLRLATRGSPLALAQAARVAARLALVGVTTDVIEVSTLGDERPDVPLAELGGTGAFAVAVQRAVLEGRADVAVHSAKDLPAATPPGLALAAVPERLDPADALVGAPLEELAAGATVATGSPRRRALLLDVRPDLKVVGLRGNMARRLDTVGRDGVSAVVTAVAALERLGWSTRASQRLDPLWFVPQVGQGALALEARESDDATRALLAGIDDGAAHSAVRAERAALRELGGGCALPFGAFATADGPRLSVRGVLAAEDGAPLVRASVAGADPETLGIQLAETLRRALEGSGA